jgi:hypothetical protein
MELMRKGNMLADWRAITQGRKKWRGIVISAVEDLNKQSEEREQ